MKIKSKITLSCDWQIFLPMLLLCLIGLVAIYSGGYDPDTGTSKQVIRQALSMLIGLGGFYFFVFIDSEFWRRWSYFIYLGVLFLLFLVILKGDVAGGSRRWLNIVGIRMQPSEFMKLAMIFLMAKIMSGENISKHGYGLKRLFIPALLVLIPAGLIGVQPDLGTALSHLLIAGSMILLSGVERRTLIGLFAVAALLTLPAWSMLHDYQRNRILTFLSPESDPLGKGYHAIQSKIAVGSGAVYGKGFLQGTQTQLRFLPEQTTDFVFSVLAEEWGFIGTIVVILLYVIIIFRLLYLASRSNDRFSALVVIGVSALLFWHVFLNIGMVIGILPVVGITLPLLSFGGTSVVTVMAALGFASGLRKKQYLFS